MITPEEDFETWKLIISTVTDDVSSFSSLFPDLQRLLRSIEQTGSLSDTLAPQTDNFIDILYPTIINPLLNLGTLDDVDVLILIESFQAIVECCTSQISSKNAKFTEILENFFTQDQRQLYRSNSSFEIRESLINFYISIDGYQKSISAIENEEENANKLGSLFNICLSSSTFLENYDSNELFDKTADAFCRVCEKDIRSFPVSVIDKIFDKITINSKWLSLFLILLRSDFFDKKLFSLQKMSKIIENDKNKDVLIDFFKENLDEIISIPIHSEFGQHLGSIYGFAASNNLLNIEQIKNIWKTEEFVHPSILQSFYSIFEILSNKLPESESVEYANLIVDTKKEPSQIWLHLISTVAKNFMNNKFKDSFEILRNKIWQISFQNDASNQLEKSAKRMLIDLCKFNSQQLIDKILDSFSEVDDFCLEMIQTAASGSEKVEKGSSLLDLAISKLPNENAVKLISTLCIDQKVPLTQEQKNLIVNHTNKEKFLEKLIFDVGFDDNDIEKYFYSLNNVNMETYIHVVKYVSNHNHFSEPLTSVPFMKEKLIWDFALKQSRVVNKFQEFLCYHYSMNDGVILNDEKMIDVFLSQISSRFEISDKNMIFKLLCEFIRTIEKNADVLSFDFKRHRFSRRDYCFTVTVGGIQQEFTIKRSATVAVVLHKVAAILRKPVEYINLFHRGYSTAATSTLESLADRRSESMFFTYNIGQSPNKVPHLRTVLPTLILHKSHLMEKLIQSAKSSKFNFNLKFLLNILPSSNESTQQVMVLKKVNSYDYQKNFPIEFPLFFAYNFEVLKENEAELKDHFKRTGGLSFFFKSLLKFQREDMLISDIIEWIEKFIPKSDDNSAVVDEDFVNLSNELFETLTRLNSTGHHPDTAKRVLNLMKKLKPTLPQCDTSYTPKIIKFKKQHNRGWWHDEGDKQNEEELKQASNVPLPDENKNAFDDNQKTEPPVLCEGNQFEPDSELMNFFTEYGKKAGDSIDSIEKGTMTESEENHNQNENEDQNNENNENDEKVPDVDESIPFSHVLADSIPTFLFSNIDAIKNASQSIFENLELPIEYLESMIDLVEVGKTKPFLDVLTKQVKFDGNKKTPTKLIEFSFNNLNTESKFWEFSLKMLNILIEFCTDEQKEKVAQFIKDNFFDLYRNDFESEILKTGFEILGKLPQYLPDCFTKIQNSSNTQLDLSLFSPESEYSVDGSDFRIERQTTGLANLGMTCFLNSILQQFFAIPLLRKILIEYKGNDDFLVELRKLFCRMRESFSAWISPKNVADHWVNWDGTKLNVRIQQDASEFVQMLVDKIAAVVPQSMFNGTLVYHIDGINEEFRTSHSEPYSILSLPISESNNLSECFNSLKTPNFFNDYFADSLNKKIEAKQTEFIGNLPDHLIIQLKRFEFEYKTWVHRKINKRIDITETIDVFDLLDSNYIKNEFGCNVATKYNLNGVVLHMGSAQGGHYFSFVRNRTTGDWYKFNDKQVTPISIQEVINDSNGSNSNAYLLFYDRENLFEVDDSVLTQQLQTEIDQENKMSVMYRFFFTPSFTLLMKEILENSTISNDLVEIAVHYSMAIMCHLSPSIDCLNVYQQIQTRIKDSNENNWFIDLILKNLHIPDFVDCSSSQIKERHFNFIYKPLAKKLASLCSSGLYHEQTKKLYDDVFCLFDKSVDKLDENGLYFKLLYRLLKIIHKQNNLMSKEEEKALGDKISNVFTVSIPEYLKEHSSIQPNYYYKSVDLGYLMKFYSLIEIPQSIIEKAKEPSFWTMLMSSKTKTKYHLSLLNKSREENLFDVDKFFIEEFLPKESMHVNMVILFGAMFMLLREKAIPLVWTTKFMIKDQFYVPSDVAFMFVLLCRNQITEDVLVEKIDQWLPSILLHENYETRILAPFAVSFLIRHKSFLSLGSVPSKDPVVFDKEFFNVLRSENPCSVEMKTRIDIVKNCLLNKCINDVEPIIEKEISTSNNSFQPISKYRAVSLLNLLQCLKEITFKNDENSEPQCVFDSDDELKITNFAEFIVNHSNICDSHIRGVAKIIDGKSCVGFLMKVLPTHNCIPSDTGIINRIGDILEILLPFADQIPPEYILNEFMPSYVFTPTSIFHKVSLKFIETFCDFMSKEQMLAAIDDNFDDNCIKNLSAVLFILQKFDAKRPVLRYSLTADTSGTPLTLNEIIEFGFRFNEKRNENAKTSEGNTNNNENTNNETNNSSSETNENKNNEATNNETNENKNNEATNNETGENKNNEASSNDSGENKNNEATNNDASENKEENSTNENKEISGADSDIISIVSLLNSNQLTDKTRSYAWQYLIENCDNLSLFNYHYKFDENIQFSTSSDFINLSKLLKKFDQQNDQNLIEKVTIPHLLHISKISFESFIENFDFLRSHESSNASICDIDFVYTIFSLIFPYVRMFVGSKIDKSKFIDISENESFINYCEIVFSGKNGIEKSALTSPLIKDFMTTIYFDNQVLNDPVENAFTEAELIDSTAPIFKLFDRFEIQLDKDQIQNVNEFLEKIKSPKIQGILKLEKIEVLINVIMKYLKI